MPFNTAPDNTYTYTAFETPQYFGNNYGSRMRGYVCVPSDGNYTFWISSDDQSELWLSSDDNPSNAVMIASVNGHTAFRQWNKYTTQQPALINLAANSRYYVEVRHKENGGNDHISVGWRLPNGALERPIPGNRIGPFDGPPVMDPDAGSVEREVWRNIDGTSIGSIPFGSKPDNVVTLTSLETQTYYANNYGSRIRGYLCKLPTPCTCRMTCLSELKDLYLLL